MLGRWLASLSKVWFFSFFFFGLRGQIFGVFLTPFPFSGGGNFGLSYYTQHKDRLFEFLRYACVQSLRKHIGSGGNDECFARVAGCFRRIAVELH